MTTSSNLQDGVQQWLQLMKNGIANTQPVLPLEQMHDFVETVARSWKFAVFLQKRMWQIWSQSTRIQTQVPFTHFWLKWDRNNTYADVAVRNWKRQEEKAILDYLHPALQADEPMQHVIAIFGWHFDDAWGSSVGGHYTLLYFDRINRIQSFSELPFAVFHWQVWLLYDPAGDQTLYQAMYTEGLLNGYTWARGGSSYGLQNSVMEGSSALVSYGFCGMLVLLVAHCCYRFQYYNMSDIEQALVNGLPPMCLYLDRYVNCNRLPNFGGSADVFDPVDMECSICGKLG